MKHIWEDHVKDAGSAEQVLREGEQRGFEPAREEAKKIGERAWDNIRKKDHILSDEDWEKVKDQLDKIFVQLRQHPEYQNAMHHLFELPSVLRMDIEEKGLDRATERVKEESKDLIGQFSGREILDRTFDKMEELRIEFQRDEEAQRWWRDFKDIIERTGRGYVGEEDLEEFRRQVDKSSELFDEYRPRINEIIDMISDIFDNMSNDQYVKELQERLSIISDDLYWVDDEGSRRFDTHTAEELTVAIGQILREQLSLMNLDDIHGEDRDVLYSLKNLNISATLPDKIKLHLESDAVLDISKRSDQKSRFQSELYLIASINDVELCAPAVSFTYNSNMLNEAGMMDVRIPSANLDIYFVYTPTEPSDVEQGFTKKLEQPWSDQYQFLRVKTYFSISNLEITFDKRTLHHKLISPVLTSWYKPYLTWRFETEIQNALNLGLREVGEKISSIMMQAQHSMPLAQLGTHGPMGKEVE